MLPPVWPKLFCCPPNDCPNPGPLGTPWLPNDDGAPNPLEPLSAGEPCEKKLIHEIYLTINQTSLFTKNVPGKLGDAPENVGWLPPKPPLLG